MKEKVLEVFRWHFKDDGIVEVDRVREDLGATSIDEAEILLAIEENVMFEINIPQSEKLKTVGDVIAYIEKLNENRISTE